MSIPDHSYQLKLQKAFRIVAQEATAAITIDTNLVASRIRSELGITATTTAGEVITVHQVNTYAAGTGGSPLLVQIHDPEETGTGNANVLGLFEDLSSSAGISSVKVGFPVHSRPKFSRATANVPFIGIAVPSGSYVVVDVIATYLRTPTTVPSRVLMVAQPSGLPSFDDYFDDQMEVDENPDSFTASGCQCTNTV